MNDDLVYLIFKELAILEGKRTIAGEWTTDDPKDLHRLLRVAFLSVRRAAEPMKKEAKPGGEASAGSDANS